MKILKGIAGYQTLIWSWTLVQYFHLMYKTVSSNGSFIIIVVQLFATLFVVVSLFTNICILFNLNKKKLTWFFNYNIWLNVIQMFSFVILGFTFYMEFGPYLLIYVTFDDDIT